MRAYLFLVVLTNGTVETSYRPRAFNDEEAVILAQATAIMEARGHKLVSVEKIKEGTR
jgi:hypothetical protein